MPGKLALPLRQFGIRKYRKDGSKPRGQTLRTSVDGWLPSVRFIPPTKVRRARPLPSAATHSFRLTGVADNDRCAAFAAESVGGAVLCPGDFNHAERIDERQVFTGAGTSVGGFHAYLMAGN